MKKIGKNEEGRKLGEKGWKGGRVKEEKKETNGKETVDRRTRRLKGREK